MKSILFFALACLLIAPATSIGQTRSRTSRSKAQTKPAPAAVAPEKVYVGCTQCGAKLKVATTSLGKKMKCPKCGA